jgi:hypothetical protein
MPSIFKRPDSPFYVCSFVAADGRRLKKSTKTNDRRKALEFCLLLEKAAMKARRNELTAAQGRKLIAEMVTISSGEQMMAHTVRDGSKSGSRTRRPVRVNAQLHDTVRWLTISWLT